MDQALSVGHNRLLAALRPSERTSPEPHLEEVPLSQGQVLQEQGRDIEQIYFPHSGMISLVAVMNNGGKMIETATIGREGAVGAMAGFGPRHAFRPASRTGEGNPPHIHTGPVRNTGQRRRSLRT